MGAPAGGKRRNERAKRRHVAIIRAQFVIATTMEERGFSKGKDNIGQRNKTLTLRLLQGKLYVRGDSKVFRFQNGKSESLFLQRKNPRRIAWTVLYRRQHRKGITEVRT